MEVEVISRETIKPSIPTPPHKIQLSSLDQQATSNYVSFLLFYSSDDNTNYLGQVKTSDELKKSLSETLTCFYPVAGRIKDDVSVDCNDEGVDYFEARVNCQLLEFLEKVNIDELDQFLPCDPFVTDAELSTRALLAIQANIFGCGGIGFGILFSHKIGDGVSMATFVNGWAAIARGANQAIPCMSFGLSSHFPIKDSSKTMTAPTSPGMQPTIVMRRFIFDASNIAALRAYERSKNFSKVEYPTRVELVSALIWWRAMAVTRAENNSTTAYALMHAVNLRKRMVPPLSNDTFGNVARPTITQFLTGEESEYHDLVGHVRDSTRKVDEKYVMELQCGNEGVMDCIKEAKQQFPEFELVMYNFNSWCRFPFYEADFGWGTPVWIATTKIPSRNLVILIDTRAGDGIEAWVNMLEEDMAQLEHDQEFLSFVSSK